MSYGGSSDTKGWMAERKEEKGYGPLYMLYYRVVSCGSVQGSPLHSNTCTHFCALTVLPYVWCEGYRHSVAIILLYTKRHHRITSNVGVYVVDGFFELHILLPPINNLISY